MHTMYKILQYSKDTNQCPYPENCLPSFLRPLQRQRKIKVDRCSLLFFTGWQHFIHIILHINFFTISKIFWRLLHTSLFILNFYFEAYVDLHLAVIHFYG